MRSTLPACPVARDIAWCHKNSTDKEGTRQSIQYAHTHRFVPRQKIHSHCPKTNIWYAKQRRNYHNVAFSPSIVSYSMHTESSFIFPFCVCACVLLYVVSISISYAMVNLLLFVQFFPLFLIWEGKMGTTCKQKLN